MQKVLKISFWISIVLAISDSGLGSMVGGYVEDYLMVAIFALPGIFIKDRLYKGAALLIFLAYLFFAHEDYLGGKRHAGWLKHRREMIQMERNANP